MVNKGIFIAIEGLDGSGKTTQATLLAEKLTSKYNVLLTNEPSNGRIGNFVSHIYLHRHNLAIEAEALMLAADRIEHMKNELKPAIDEGRLVICDRYVYSSIAYQGSAGLSIDWIKTINARGIQPEIAFFIDAPLEQIAKRLKANNVSIDLSGNDVRNVFLKLVERGDLILIDGDKPKEVVSEIIYEETTKLLNNFY